MSTGPEYQDDARRVDIHVHRAHAQLEGNHFQKCALRGMQVGTDTATWWT